MAQGRTHIVLIPGFAGFDALGQLEYYFGVTPEFGKWAARNDSGETSLRYFDNFPTAAVHTRAARLRRYLEKRIVRGEIQRGDAIALVGHSTGGLDIRRLIWALSHGEVDDAVDGGASVSPAEILNLIRKVVFLSVPHHGTNIADYVKARSLVRQMIVVELRASIAGVQMPLLAKVEEWVASAAASLMGADLLRALQDALTEADATGVRPASERLAAAHEAASQLELWLRHIAWDFGAIDDLTARPPIRSDESPAHFDRDQRSEELDIWNRRGIEALSYITCGKAPGRKTDPVYRVCYGACAAGPFAVPRDSSAASSFVAAQNDGIVNSGSMFWPIGRNIPVACDHMDIAGHYELVQAAGGSGRKYQAYDLLGSASGFKHTDFVRIWTEIFGFCASHSARKRASAAGA